MIENDEELQQLIKSIGKVVFRSNGKIKWMNLLGLIVTCGSIAILLLEQDASHALIHRIPFLYSELLTGDILKWVVWQGGWSDLDRHYKVILDGNLN